MWECGRKEQVGNEYEEATADNESNMSENFIDHAKISFPVLFCYNLK